ncbi:MAG: hypothetical protein R3F56_12325 [Planctomycetota bacterium]
MTSPPDSPTPAASPQPPARTVAAAVEHLRRQALPPAWFDRHVGEGALFDAGWAIWGPVQDARQAFQGTGYTNGVRVDAPEDYESTLSSTAGTDPGVLSPADFAAVRTEHNEADAVLLLAEFPDLYGGGAGGAATSAALQATVFSPEPQGGAVGLHDFATLDQLQAAASRAGMALYHNIGIANVPWARTAYLDFNHRFSMEVRTPEPPRGGDLLRRELWAIGPGRARFVATDQHVVVAPFQVSKVWPHFVFDPTHPEVVAVCMQQVREFVQRTPAAKGYFLRGENLHALTPEPGLARITRENFDRRAPLVNFAPHLTAGFEAYMRTVVGDDEARLAARWDLPGITFASIDLRGAHWTAEKPVVAQDYADFLEFVIQELGARHYIEAKRTRMAGWYSVLGFGPKGAERSALESDFPSVGNYYDDEQQYYGGARNSLALMADVVRLSGKPMAFAVSGVPFRPRKPAPRLDTAWYRLCLKDITLDHVRLFFREVLTAGVAHVGYVKALVHGLIDHPPSIQAVNDGLAELAGMRERALLAMGPYQRVAIHVDTLERISYAGIADEEPSPYLGALVAERLRRAQVPAAVFGDARLLQRTFARWHLRRSLTLVMAPASPEARVFAYAELLTGGGAGAAVVVLPLGIAGGLVAALQAAGGAASLVTTLRSNTEPNDTAALLHLTLPGFGATRVFLFAFRDPLGGEGLRAWGLRCADLIDQVHAELAALAGVVLRPASAAVSPAAPLFANCVTDGLNATLAVSWPDPGPAPPRPFLVSVDPRWQGRFDPSVVQGFAVEVAGGHADLAPPQTRYVHVEARLHPAVDDAVARGGAAQVIDDVTAALAQLENQGFEVAHGRTVLAFVQGSLAAGRTARALAGLASLARMVFVRAQRLEPGRVWVEARHVWRDGGGGVAPVASAEAQVLLPLNAHEEQAPVALAGGTAVLGVPAPRHPRWDFAHGSRLRTPQTSDVEGLLEVHVTERIHGGHGVATVLPVPIG